MKDLKDLLSAFCEALSITVLSFAGAILAIVVILFAGFVYAYIGELVISFFHSL
jgi:hypothetical protein